MSLNVSLPGVSQSVIESGGTATRPYYTFFQSVATSLKTLSDQIDNVTTTPPESPISENANVVGKYSIYTRGILKNGIVSVLLIGDVETPSATQYYGSNANGERGWYAVADAFAESSNVTLTTDADGITTPDLSNTGITAGSYGSAAKAVAVTFDAKGRATGVVEKDLRTLSDTAPASPVSGQRWIDTTTGTEYVWYVDADSSQWVEFGPNAVSVADGPAVQTVSSGTGINVDNTDPANPIISYAAAALGYDEGTSFPLSPAADDKFYRTDLNLLCYYDGTRWLTCTEYSIPAIPILGSMPLSSNGVSMYVAPFLSNGAFVTRMTCGAFVNSPNTASSFWTVALEWVTAANVATSLGSFVTSADTVANWSFHQVTIGTAITSSAKQGRINITKTGSPGSLFIAPVVYYRLIVT